MNDLTPLARKLRREQTPAERTLWRHLSNRKNSNAKFRRQHPSEGYIVNFVCPEHMLVVELDGGHHNNPQVKFGDDERSRRLEMAGYRVLRFWNNEIEGNLAGVLESIAQALETE